MPRYIAFLRAINVGGRNIKMVDLCAHFGDMGFASVESFIASGNIIFETSMRSRAKIAATIEAHLHDSLGYQVDTFLRTPAEVIAIAGYKPFKPQMLARAEALGVGLLANPLSPTTRKKLSTLRTDIDDFHSNDTEVYWMCMKKQSESKMSNAVFEKAINARATFRTIKTFQRLAVKYPA